MNLPNIPVAAPVLSGNERAYVVDCLDEGWISSTGKYIGRFEKSFAEYCGTQHAIACCNGTVAVHLALLAFDIGPGDEVIVPSLTFIATANAVKYCGATPVFADSERTTWNIDPEDVERKITSRTKAIIAVHLYGHPADMQALRRIADDHKLALIEDAAEAHGARCHGKRAGGLGDVSTFSFYGNKIITTGEGGMVLTDKPDLASKIRLLRGQGMDPTRRYWFPVVGYNYRMTNIAAAIGLAQLEQIDQFLTKRAEVAQWYDELLADVPGVALQPVQPWAESAYWMVTALLDNAAMRDPVMQFLATKGIETRPIFYPLHILPPYEKGDRPHNAPVSEELAARGFNLPTWTGLDRSDVVRIVETLKEALSTLGASNVTR